MNIDLAVYVLHVIRCFQLLIYARPLLLESVGTAVYL